MKGSKNHSGAKKRFRCKKSGFYRLQGNRSHLLTKKSRGRKRRLDGLTKAGDNVERKLVVALSGVKK